MTSNWSNTNKEIKLLVKALDYRNKFGTELDMYFPIYAINSITRYKNKIKTLAQTLHLAFVETW